MGSFFKKIKQWFSDDEVEIIHAPITTPKVEPNPKERYFTKLTNTSELCRLFVIDPIPPGPLPVYDLGGGEKEIITIEDGKPKYMKTDWTKINVQLQEYITEEDIKACLLLACKHAQVLDNIYVDDYRKTFGWASVTGNKLEDRLYKNIYIKDFPRTLLLPESDYLGVICQATNQNTSYGMGFFMFLEKVRVV